MTNYNINKRIVIAHIESIERQLKQLRMDLAKADVISDEVEYAPSNPFLGENQFKQGDTSK